MSQTIPASLLDNVFNNLPIGVVAADIKTTQLVYANPCFLSMFGFSQSDLTSLKPLDLHPKDEHARVLAEFKMMVQGHLKKTNQLKAKRKDGTIFIADVHLAASDPELSGLVIATFQDITDEFNAEQALKEKEARLRLAFSVTNQAWFDIDVAKNKLRASPEHAIMLGFEPSSVALTVQAWMHMVHPADRRKIFNAFKVHLADPTQEMRLELRQQTKNDDWLWTQVYGKVTQWSAENKPLRIIGLCTDINKQKHLQAQLANERTFLKSILSNIPDLIWLKDKLGVYIGCNRRFESLYGAEEKHIIGKRDYDFVEAGVADIFRHYDLLALQRSEPIRNEEWLTFKSDGHTELVETTKVALRNAEDELIGVLGIAHDITERKSAEDKLKLAAMVFKTAQEGIIITDNNAIIVDVNDSFTRITGYKKAQVIGKNANILSSGRQDKRFYELLWKTLNTAGRWSGEIYNRRANGEVFAEFLNICSVRDNRNQVSHYIAVFSDISTLKEQEKQLKFVSQYDVLTGLPNRALLLTLLRKQLLSLKQAHKSAAIIVIDVDGFRFINETHGNKTGDQVLIEAANRFKLQLREHDLLSRVGGDEFVVVLTDLTDPHFCVSVIERLLAASSTPFLVENKKLNLTASVGVTFIEVNNDISAEKLIRQADQAMYQAKLSGKNRFHVYNPDDDKDTRDRFELINEIRDALHNDEFELYYQPKIELRTGSVVGFEALIRWNHPTKGVVLPGYFIPVITNHPLAIEIGNWVARAAIEQLAQWNHQGYMTTVSINVDSLQLNDPNFSHRLLQLFDNHPTVVPSQLELEILETSALEEIQNVSQLIENLKRKQIHFSLDDFGTGYSSMTFLKTLPATTIKIDQSFVKQMLYDPEQMIIVDSIIKLSKRFNRKILAEGVESNLHGLFLSALGCEQAQGYGIAKPMPASKVLEWLETWHSPALWTNTRLLDTQEVDTLLTVVRYIGKCRGLRIDHYNEAVVQMPFTASEFACWKPVLQRLSSPELALLNETIPMKIEALRFALNHGQSCEELSEQSKVIIESMLKVVFDNYAFTLPDNCDVFDFQH